MNTAHAMSEQLPLELPHRPALEAEDFLVSVCNEAAVRLVDAWPDWPSPAHALIGAEGSGKTHLANVWRLKTGALPILPRDAIVEGAASAVLLEDIDIAGWDEQELFHCLNRCRESGLSLLMTARTPPAHLDVRLPDLRSRLRSVPTVAIGAPDDALLRAVLLKQFADRQLNVEPSVIAFLAARMERSMQAARRLVAEIDRASLASGRGVTRAFAAQVLGNTGLSNDPELPLDAPE